MQDMLPFPPDVSWIQDGRALEVEAVDPGRSSFQIMAAPPSGTSPEEESVVLTDVGDVQGIEQRIDRLSRYVPHAREAFEDRGLAYPFSISNNKDSLQVTPGLESTARKVAELSEMVAYGGQVAKEFEVRATKALHRLVGGWAVCVGAPRRQKEQFGGLEKAIRGFRAMLRKEVGEHFPLPCAPSGDDGVDSFFILGRDWAGPLLFLQSKNSVFSIKDIPQEFSRRLDICLNWFGKHIGLGRAVIPVYAVNSVLTHEMKERIYAAGSGCHVIDAVDIIVGETLPGAQLREGELLEVL